MARWAQGHRYAGEIPLLNNWVLNHYDGRARTFGRDIRAADYVLSWTFRRRQEALRRLTQSFKGKKILDLGCGPGLLSQPLARDNFLVGLDLSRNMLELARPFLCPLQGEGENLPFRDSSFDAILAIENLQHVKDPLPFLSEMARVVRPGGRLILSTLHSPSFYHQISMWLGKTGNHFFHSWKEIEAVLKKLGIVQLETLYLGSWGIWDTNGWEPVKSFFSIAWMIHGIKSPVPS